MLEKKERPIVHARRAGAEPALEAQRVALLLDRALLLFPFHAEGRIRQHVIELLVGEAVFREGVAEDDVIGVLAFNEHVGFADRPGVIIPILTVEHWLGFVVELTNVMLRNREHAARSAGRIVNRLHDVAVREVFLRREEEIHHQLDHFARGEMFARLFVGLLCTDADELFEDVAHLHIVDLSGGEIDLREGFDDLVEEILLRHPGDLLVEPEALHDAAYVRRELADVAVEIRGELIRIVEQLLEIKFREIVKRALRNFLEQASNDCLRFLLNGGILFENRRLGWREQTVKTPENGQRQDDLAIFVPFIRPTQKIADAPNEVCELGMRRGRHWRKKLTEGKESLN